MADVHEVQLNSVLDAQCTSLGDTPAGVITAALWRDLSSRMVRTPPSPQSVYHNPATQGYDQLALRMHSGGCGAIMLKQLRDVVDSTLSDMMHEGTSDDLAAVRAGLDEGMANKPKKRSRVLSGTTKVKTEPGLANC